MTWDELYAKGEFTMNYPSECIVRFVCNYKKRYGNGYRALDLGCGNGRHLELLAREGFSAYGIDISEKAIELAKERRIEAIIQRRDITKLPYTDETFGIVISYGVLDHMLMKDALKAMSEVRRVLKPHGRACVNVVSTDDVFHEHYAAELKPVEPNTYKIPSGFEKGQIQHYFSTDELMRLVDGFNILTLENEERTVIGPLRNYMHSRWVVEVEK